MGKYFNLYHYCMKYFFNNWANIAYLKMGRLHVQGYRSTKLQIQCYANQITVKIFGVFKKKF